MGERFNDELKAFFGCEDGAYSEVSESEWRVGQINVAGYEKTIIRNIIKDIPWGPAKTFTKRGIDPSYKFKIYPSGEFGILKIYFQKPDSNELRLYIKNNVFRPKPGLIWFVFIKHGKLWVGALEAGTFERVREGNAGLVKAPVLFDLNDADYQEALYSKDPAASYEALTKRFKRDPRIARNALEESGYICELRPDLETFQSKISGKPYLEVHHVIPVSLQPEFECSLDVLDNVAVLNPWSHRLLHHAPPEVLKPYLGRLCESRGGLLQALNLKADDVFNFYSQV